MNLEALVLICSQMHIKQLLKKRLERVNLRRSNARNL